MNDVVEPEDGVSAALPRRRLWLRPRRDAGQPRRMAPLAAALALAVLAGAVGLAVGVRTSGSPGPAAGGSSPPPRAGAAMAFDADTGTTILFGGASADGTALGDTWSWDGSAWTRLHPAVSPPARTGAALGWDASRHQLVLVGGTSLGPPGALPPCIATPTSGCAASGSGVACAMPVAPSPPAKKLAPCPAPRTFTSFDDTWTWDGSTWTQAHPAHVPSAGEGAGLAWDAHDGVLVLSRQTGFAVSPLASQAAAPTQVRCLPVGAATDEQPSPAPTGGAAAVPTRLFCHPLQPVPSTWTWNGSDWTARDAAGTPPLALAADPAGGRVLGLGGMPFACGVVTVPPPASGSTPGGAGGSAGSTGSTGSSALPDIACPALGAPVPAPAATGAPATPGAGAARVGVRPLPVVGPSVNLNQRAAQTLRWSGSWMAVATPQAPAPEGIRLATDGAHGTVLALTLAGSTWTWDGNAWHLQHPATSPGGLRVNPALASDAHGVVLFGGFVRGRLGGDTWTWDGHTWTHRSGSVPPAPSIAPAPTLLPGWCAYGPYVPPGSNPPQPGVPCPRTVVPPSTAPPVPVLPAPVTPATAPSPAP